MIAGRQIGDERRDGPGPDVHRHDAGAVVLPGRMGRLVRVGREQPSASEAVLEPDIHCRACRLQATLGSRLGQRLADLLAVLIEHQNIRRERVVRVELAFAEAVLLIAHGWAGHGPDSRTKTSNPSFVLLEPSSNLSELSPCSD